MMSPETLKNSLAHFYGTERYHRWSILFKKHVLTDGAHFLAENAECYWLMDLIASYAAKLKNEEFQLWTLKVNNQKAVVTCDDGNRNILVTQKIECTDFPLDEIQLYCLLGSIDGVNPQWVILLPSEN